MAIDFPSSPVGGSTYDYEGVRYTWQDRDPDEGYWKVGEPGQLGPATGAEVDTGTDNAKFLTPLSMGESKYVHEESDGVTTLDYSGAARLTTSSGGVDVLGDITGTSLRANYIYLEGTSGSIRFKDTDNGNQYTAIDAAVNGLNINQLDSGGTFDKTHVKCNTNGSIDLYYNGAVKAQTKVDGLDVTGKVTADNGFDSSKIGVIDYLNSSPSGSLVSGSLAADTSLGISEIRVSGLRVGTGLSISGRFNIYSFNIAMPNDNVLDVRVDITAALATVGITSIGTSHFGTAVIEFDGSTGDFPHIPAKAWSNSGNVIRIETEQLDASVYVTDQPSPNATSCEICFSLVIPDCIGGDVP